MLFPSPIFLFLFLPLTLVIYFLLPKKSVQNIFLLLASAFFYAWGEGSYIAILFGLILINYLFGLVIDKTKRKKLVLSLGIIFNVASLIYFKYLIFGLSVVTKFIDLPFKIDISSIHMPLGISFITFHLISYIFDIYRQKIKAEKNILDFALYIFLFPHLIAGPIVRYADIGRQIKDRVVTIDSFYEGIRRFIYGLGKKVLIANVLAAMVDNILKIFPQNLSSEIVWLALIGYALQIYFDFSGYSDMAIGLALMFGFRFNENFNYPYLATSITDFWRRWHITLSSWFRDYVYIPLGGNRKGLIFTCINIIVVFSLTGFWHGANFHFLFWGFYYGIFLVLEKLFLGKVLERVWLPLRHLYALFIIMIGWLFFRVENLNYSFFLLKRLLGLDRIDYPAYSIQTFLNLENTLVLIAGFIFATPFIPRLFERFSNSKSLIKYPLAYGNLLFMVFVLIYSIMQLASNTYNPFIYFRF